MSTVNWSMDLIQRLEVKASLQELEYLLQGLFLYQSMVESTYTATQQSFQILPFLPKYVTKVFVISGGA
jgi:hypothetical protein